MLATNLKNLIQIGFYVALLVIYIHFYLKVELDAYIKGKYIIVTGVTIVVIEKSVYNNVTLKK